MLSIDKISNEEAEQLILSKMIKKFETSLKVAYEKIFLKRKCSRKRIVRRKKIICSKN